MACATTSCCATVSGCAPATTRRQWPCDAAPSGDNNGCTEEACCEPWNPDGCREHRLIEDATPDGEAPQLEQFCTAAVNDGQTATVATALGAVECAQGDLQYALPIVDPVSGGVVVVPKPNGYWCYDCNPCTTDACTFPFGTCSTSFVDDGTSVDEPPPIPGSLGQIHPADLVGGCELPQECDQDRNFGCGREACFAGDCFVGPHPNGPDGIATCSGFPVVEYDDDEEIPLFPEAGASTCFELGCENTGGIVNPNWTCVATPDDATCDNGLFCDGPPACSFDAFCDGCNGEDVGAILASVATGFQSQPPAPGSLVNGCVIAGPEVVCDDAVACTADVCSESTDSCESIGDDRACTGSGDDWMPCEPVFVCDDFEGCMPTAGMSPCGFEGCVLDCEAAGGTRTCTGDAPLCPEPVCFSERYVSVPLQPLTNLCPFHPDGTIPQGDREFGGNGPVVSVDVSLEVSADRHRVLATVLFEARETQDNFSTIRFEFPPMTVYDTTEEILAIVSETSGRAVGVSADGGTAGTACGGCGIVDFTTIGGIIAHIEARGDTPDNDISDDPSCDDDTLLQVLEFNTANVLVREDCLP